MIPPQGRDVQCSNCQTTWFQPGRGGMPAEMETGMSDIAPEAERPRRPAPPPPPERMAEPEPQPETEASDDIEEMAASEPDGGAEEEDLPRRKLDPELQAMLQDERARSEVLRRQPEGLESQGDLDLPEPPLEEPLDEPETQPEIDAEIVMDRDALDDRPGGSRRDLFPDIEEINSTLRATDDRQPGRPDGNDVETVTRAPRHRAGFRIGFLVMIVLGVLVGGLYTQADALANLVPGLEPFLDDYTATIDRARIWLDEVVRGGAGQLTRSLGN